MTKLAGCKSACGLLLFCAATAIASPAQNFTSLAAFNGDNGANPQYVSLVQGTNGNFYGTTYQGGSGTGCFGGDGPGCGTVFEITPGGTLNTLYSFCSRANCTDGYYPYGGLIQIGDGNLYGTTAGGGTNYSYGTVFKITAKGELTTLYSFCSSANCADGSNPYGALVQGTDGNLYGTTDTGGIDREGTVFKITPQGKLTTLYRFCSRSGCVDGAEPYAGLVQGIDGNFYGTTYVGGANDNGVVFKISPKGDLTTLYSFCSLASCTDGSSSFAPLVQGSDGNFYGTTAYGGATGCCGTVFRITPYGKLTTLYSFCSQVTCPDGGYPFAGLVRGTDGMFYGTTGSGSMGSNYGTVFKISRGGSLTTLYSFCPQTGCPDGAYPFGGVSQATNGKFYGVASAGGSDLNCSAGCGTVFSVFTGLGAFVETKPTSGRVGAAVIILGTNLAGATGVSFNGTAATFKVVSRSEITATVPSGATSGEVEVTTPRGTLKSNMVFRVKPSLRASRQIAAR